MAIASPPTVTTVVDFNQGLQQGSGSSARAATPLSPLPLGAGFGIAAPHHVNNRPSGSLVANRPNDASQTPPPPFFTFTLSVLPYSSTLSTLQTHPCTR